MATLIKSAVKDFNPDRLKDELEVASILPEGVLWAGFERINNRLLQPAEQISKATGQPDVVYPPGELHFDYPTDPGAALDTILAAHDATLLSRSQTNADRDIIAGDAHENAFNEWDTLTPAQKGNANKQAQRSLARLFNSNKDL